MSGSNFGQQAQVTSDLTTCDREPIHHIGAIQPIGFLVALSNDWVISRVSANVAEYLGSSSDALLGAQFRDVISSDAGHTIRNRLLMLHGANAVERAFAVRLQHGGALFDLAIHMIGQTIVIEGEPSEPAGELNAGAMVRSMLARLQGKTSLPREAARLVQALTGFDRVMIYRFHPDNSGEVIAERARLGLEPYLGLRYPAEDIPQQARLLLVRNPVRLLADVAAEPSPIVPQLGVVNEPLDLSMSTLRAHSTMCIEYLTNMGVGATMAISLVRGDRLWGLISCHHMTRRHVGFELRTTVELFAQMLSFVMERQERDELATYETHTRQLQSQLVAALIERGTAAENIAELADRMAELVPCDGFAACVNGNVTLKGATPSMEEFNALRRFLDRTEASQIFATDELGQAYAPARHFVERAAGMLVIPISRSPRDYLVFFRHEVARSVIWAGEPGKLLVSGPHGARLTPRRSFEAWREIKRGHSAPWTEAELHAAEMLRTTLLEVVLHLIGMTEKESRAATQKQELLIAELNHRVRNILGLIRGLIAQSRTSAADIDTYATVLGDRVHALARAHDQITAKNWGPGSLAVLVATEVAAFLGVGAIRVHASGPGVLLQPQAFSTTALVIHELLTNAVKHGALSVQTGEIMIEWSLDGTGDVILEWIELGGPPTQEPTRRGFGSTIIQRSVPHELGGKATLDYAVTGLRARFVLPVSHIVIGDDPALTVLAEADANHARLYGAVLLVEDNMIIALDAEDILLSLGAVRVVLARNVAEALNLIALDTPSFALLDINLGFETSWPIAAQLRKLGFPYVFATGYGDGIDYPLEHRGAPAITKPYTSPSIARAFGELMEKLPEIM
jgi:light-regulated signal transduction histidine kinase (bacteriophytochrome)/CheY-like chemotaxis protein